MIGTEEHKIPLGVREITFHLGASGNLLEDMEIEMGLGDDI